MKYVTDAAREYAKKHVKDAKHSFEEVKNYIENAPNAKEMQIFVYADESNENRITANMQYGDEVDEYESIDFSIDYDDPLPIEEVTMFDIQKQDVHTDKVEYFTDRSLSKIFKLFDTSKKHSDESNDDIQEMAKIFFEFVQLHNDYVDKAYKLDAKLNKYMKQHHILGTDLVDVASYIHGAEHINFDDFDKVLDLFEHYTSK